MLTGELPNVVVELQLEMKALVCSKDGQQGFVICNQGKVPSVQVLVELSNGKHQCKSLLLHLIIFLSVEESDLRDIGIGTFSHIRHHMGKNSAQPIQ